LLLFFFFGGGGEIIWTSDELVRTYYNQGAFLWGKMCYR